MKIGLIPTNSPDPLLVEGVWPNSLLLSGKSGCNRKVVSY